MVKGKPFGFAGWWDFRKEYICSTATCFHEKDEFMTLFVAHECNTDERITVGKGQLNRSTMVNLAQLTASPVL